MKSAKTIDQEVLHLKTQCSVTLTRKAHISRNGRLFFDSKSALVLGLNSGPKKSLQIETLPYLSEEEASFLGTFRARFSSSRATPQTFCLCVCVGPYLDPESKRSVLHVLALTFHGASPLLKGSGGAVDDCAR